MSRAPLPKTICALDLYRTIAILLQVAGWLAVLACLYTLQAGRATRRVYEAEWATEAYALVRRTDHALAPADGPTAHAAATTVTTTTVAAAPAIHSDQVQAILNSTGTATNKLRALATLANLQWRHSRGHKQHMHNSDIRSALATVFAADILTQLS